jgi:hypothetical protein
LGFPMISSGNCRGFVKLMTTHFGFHRAIKDQDIHVPF